MELNLAGKSVVVTGGGSNIGRAITLAFARERSHVTIAEIDEGQGKKVAAEASSAGAASAVVTRTDVTKWESVQATMREVEARLGRVDVLVNNVGWTMDRLFVEKAREEWEKEIRAEPLGDDQLHPRRPRRDDSEKVWGNREPRLRRRTNGRVP